MSDQPLSQNAQQIAALYTRWIGLRAVFHRGWWLVTSLYLIVEADLSPVQLVFLGTAQGIVAVMCEIPAGVVADTISRKTSLLIAHALMSAAMVGTGLVTSFEALIATQMLWGLAWTFSSGADIAWLTDEMKEPDQTAQVITRGARWEQVGSAAGLLAFGAFAWVIDLSAAMILAGASMGALGLFVGLKFPERGFRAIAGKTWVGSFRIFHQGLSLALSNKAILGIFLATLLVNGADEAFVRLYPKGLLEFGFPAELPPILWLTMLGLASLLGAAMALALIERRIALGRTPSETYLLASFCGVLGLLMFSWAPSVSYAMLGVVLVQGIAMSVMRVMSVIAVNERTGSDVRATVQSFLAQMEYAGEIALGLSLGALAQFVGIDAAMTCAAALILTAGFIVRSRS